MRGDSDFPRPGFAETQSIRDVCLGFGLWREREKEPCVLGTGVD